MPESQSPYSYEALAYRVVDRKEWIPFIGVLMDLYPVMGPCRRRDQPGFYKFDWLSVPEDCVAQYTTTTLPPKKAFSPPRETLFHFKTGSSPEARVVREEFPFALVGVHPCDLAALECLDMAHLDPPAETLWPENRKRAVIVGMDCVPDEYCFCTSVGTWDARYPCDLFFTDVGESYCVEIYTQKGQDLLGHIQSRSVQDQDLDNLEQQQHKKKAGTTAQLNATVSQLADILETGALNEVWNQTAERCYSCGSCNITCPTCFCFNMHDDFDFSMIRGSRYRTWDSCQLQDFALVAGGENMRPQSRQRVRHRWHRKFLYLYHRFGRAFCTGCGRCSRSCTADINIADVTNQIIAAGTQEGFSE